MTTPPPPFSWTLLGLGVLGFAVLWWLANRATDDRRLRQVVLASYTLRIFLGFLLYTISYYHWPILPSLHSQNGFWTFGLDSHVYHYFGTQIAEAWRHGTEVPDPVFAFDYFAVIASLYLLLGAHPLYPIFLNGFLGAANGLLAFLISRKFLSHRAAFFNAILVGFWPSSCLWSVQLLKDTLSWSALFASLWLIVTMSSRPVAKFRGPRAWLAGRYVVLGVLVMLLTRLRFYVGITLALTVLLVLVPVALGALLRREARTAIQHGVLVGVIVLSVLSVRSLNLRQLLSPRHPEQGHMALAMRSWRAGDLPQAERAFSHALQLNPGYLEAKLGLARVVVQAGRWDDAITLYLSCVDDVNPEDRAPIKHLLARLYVEQANEEVKRGRLPKAASAYERAIAVDPTSASAYANLGMLLAQQQQFPPAIQTLQRALELAQTRTDRERIGSALAWLEMRQRIKALEEHSAALDEALTTLHEAIKEEAAAFEQALQTVREHVEEKFHTLQGEASGPSTIIARSSTMPLTPQPGSTLQELLAAERSVSPSKGAGAVLLPESGLEPLFSQSSQELMAEAASIVSPRTTSSKRSAQLPVHRPYGGISVTRQARRTIQTLNFEALHTQRQGYVSAGGRTLLDAEVQLSNPRALLAYLPRALMIGFLAPFPSQWFDIAGSVGIMRLFSGLEMLLLYLLLPVAAIGVWQVIQSRRREGLLLTVFVFLTAVALSLVVANIGTLFRLRLVFLLPGLLLVGAGDPRRFYGRLVHGLYAGKRCDPVDLAGRGPADHMPSVFQGTCQEERGA